MGAKEEVKALMVAQEALTKIVDRVGPDIFSTAIEIECARLAATALDDMNVLLGLMKPRGT